MEEHILKQAVQQVQKAGKTLVVIQKGAIVFEGENRGVADLLNLYTNQPELLKDAYVVDKVIGKAVAVLCVLGDVKEAYGLTMSESAIDFFEKKSLVYDYQEKTDRIINRMKTGMCPIESSVYDLDDENEALQAMKKRLQELRQGK